MKKDNLGEQTIPVGTEFKGQILIIFTRRNPTKMNTATRGKYVGEVLKNLESVVHLNFSDYDDIETVSKLYFAAIEALTIPKSKKSLRLRNQEFLEVLEIAGYQLEQVQNILSFTRFKLSQLSHIEKDHVATIDLGFSVNIVYVDGNELHTAG